MSRRSQRTDDGTPLSIIQEELFEIQRQRRQIELQTPKGPPPDMPYYASVAPPTKSTSTPSSNFSNGEEEEEDDDDVEQQKPSTLKKENAPRKKKQTGAVPVDLHDPTEIQVPLIQERASTKSVRRVKIGLVLTLFFFICMYVFPLLTNVPPEKRTSAMTVLSVAVGLGAAGATLWPIDEEA